MTHLRLLERALLVACVALAMMFVAVRATADTWELSFTGDIVSTGGFPVFSTGEPVSGSMLYDTTSPDVSADPLFGSYPGAVRAGTYQFGTYTATGGEGELEVALEPAFHRLIVRGPAGGASVDNYFLVAMAVVLTDNTATALPNDSIPTSAELADFDDPIASMEFKEPDFLFLI